MDTEVLVVTGLAIAATAVWIRWKFSRQPSCMNIPGNNGQWPLLGDTMRLLNPRTMASYQVSSRKRWNNQVWRTSVLFKKCVFVSGNEYIKKLASEEMSKRNTQACFPPHHKALFGKHSILVTSGEEHDKVRKVITPLLQPSLFKKEIDMAAAAFVEDCLLSCEQNPDEYFPLVPKFKQFTLRVVLRIVMGDERWEEWSNTNTNRMAMLLEDFAIWSKGLLSAPTANIPFTPAYRAMSARNRIKCVLTEVIEEERKALEVENSHLADTSSLDSGAKSSLIRRLLKESEKHPFITDDVIVDNILTFLFAGTDTTASILTSSFYELAKNPTLLNRLQSCVNSDVEGTEHKSDDVLLAFISEVQRVYPAAPFTMREIIREGINMGDGLGTIPPGYLVTYSIAGTLLDDEISYPRPRVFDLDRWLVRDKPHVCAFGGGNRLCPGRFLANAESIALLRLVLSEHGFNWKLKEDHSDFLYKPGHFPVDDLMVCIWRGQ
jgi:cytochrome P450